MALPSTSYSLMFTLSFLIADACRLRFNSRNVLCVGTKKNSESLIKHQRFSGIPVPTRYRGSTHVWSRIQYRLGRFQGPVSDSVPFRLVSESRFQSQIRLWVFLSPGFSPGFDRPGQDPGFGTELITGVKSCCE